MGSSARWAPTSSGVERGGVNRRAVGARAWVLVALVAVVVPACTDDDDGRTPATTTTSQVDESLRTTAATGRPAAVAVTGSTVWVADDRGGRVVRIDADTRRPA